MAKETFDREIIIGIAFGVGFFIAQAAYDEIKKRWKSEPESYAFEPY